MEIAGVTCQKEGEILYFCIDGDIDHHSAKFIRETIDKEIFLTRPRVMILELSEVDFMDSSGLGLILGRYTRMREIGGLLKLSNPTPQTVKILALAGVDKLIPIMTQNTKEVK
ncbi:MAG: STAS domain-containing protein [Clostridia bacterium]|nr:STAS domain-containing protein [Clostridia bacterium]